MPPRWQGEARRPGYGGVGGQMAVQRELAARGKLKVPKQCHPIPGSPSARSGEAAGGWWNGGVLGQLLGMAVRRSRLTEGRRCGVVVVLSLAGLEVDRQRGVGRVWWKPCATDV
uniref:Uncharacterized protein n=1 Tax=Oryza barthii TaxID=65489 RepID=A0A0D3FNQ4_9ORYZ